MKSNDNRTYIFTAIISFITYVYIDLKFNINMTMILINTYKHYMINFRCHDLLGYFPYFFFSDQRVGDFVNAVL